MKRMVGLMVAAMGLVALHGVAHARMMHRASATTIQATHGTVVVAPAESGDDGGEGDSGSGSDDGE